MEKPPFVTWRLALFVAAVLIILGVVLALVITDARSSYFVGLDGEEVVIYRGQPDGWLWIDPTIEEREGFDISDLNDADIEFVEDRVEFDSFEEARDRADGLIQRAITDEP